MYTAMEEDGPHQKPGEVLSGGGSEEGALACGQVSGSLESV